MEFEAAGYKGKTVRFKISAYFPLKLSQQISKAWLGHFNLLEEGVKVEKP